MNATFATLLAAVASAAVTVAAEAAPQPSPSAIVVQDQASLRAAPRDGAQQQASLWQGEVLEVRGERLDYLQVWDHKRERGGFIRASDVRRVALTEAEGPALLAVMRFVQDTPGAEALGIGLTAAYLQAAPAKALAGVEGAQAFDALGTFADRLARRASVAVPGKASALRCQHTWTWPTATACALRPTRSKAACRSATRARPFAACWPCPWPMPSSAPVPSWR